MNAPSVSVAIRAYRRRWLGEAIASVLAQSHADLELVVYDDHGGLLDLVRTFGDDRIRYERGGGERSAAGRYRAAFHLCRGHYVALLDDDDHYEPDFLARLVAELDRDTRVGAAACCFAWEFEGRVVLPSERSPLATMPATRAFVSQLSCPAPTSAVLTRRSAFIDGERSCPLPDGVAPDWFVNARTASGWRFTFVDAPLVVRRWHGEQLSREQNLAAHDRAVETWLRLPTRDGELDSLRRRQLAAVLMRRAGRHLLDGESERARADLRQAFAEHRRSWRWRRRALRLASMTGPLGRRTLKVYFRLPHVRDRHEGPPTKRTAIGRGAGSIAAGGAVGQLLILLAAPILARLYSPAALGAASVVVGAAALVGPLVCLRFDVAIPIAAGRGAVADLCALCLAAAAGAALVLAAVVLVAGGRIAALAHAGTLSSWLWVLPVQVFIGAVGLVATGLLVRAEKYRGLGRTRWARAAGMCTAQLGAGALGAGAPGLVAGSLAGSVAYAAAALGASRLLSQMRSSPRRLLRAARRYACFATWSTVGSVFYLGGVAALPIFVAVLYGATSAGFFVLAQRLIQVPVQVTSDAVGVAWFGTAARLVRQDAAVFRVALARLLLRLGVAGVVLLPAAVLVAPHLLAPIFGTRWSGAGALFPALAVAQLALFLAAPAGLSLQVLERTGLQAAITLARFVAGAGGLATASALGWHLTAGVELLAAGNVAISAVAIAITLRLAAQPRLQPARAGLPALVAE